MSVIFIVLPLAFVLAALAVWGFIWAVRQGQLDDLDTPALRVLLDDEPRRDAPTRPLEAAPAPPPRERL